MLVILELRELLPNSKLKYYWPNMFIEKDCENYVKSCFDCGSKKRPGVSTKAELHPLPLAYINQRWSIDLVKMPRSISGNEWALTFTEHCSRYICAFAIPDAHASTIAQILFERICLVFGFPRQLLSDLGQNLIGKVMTEVCKLLNIHRLYTSPYRPQCNGLQERSHSTLATNLTFYIKEKHNDWDKYLAAICYAYNTTIALDSTGYSPFFLMFGREPLSPLDTILPEFKVSQSDLFLNEYISKLIKAREVATANLQKAQTKMKNKYDKKVGDLVWIHTPEINVGGSKKFLKKKN
jgi:hypothetical protein